MAARRPTSPVRLSSPAVVNTLAYSRLITHSFIVVLALAAALASNVSLGVTSRASLGGQGFVARWRGWDRTPLPTDSAHANLRTPALARTRTAAEEPRVEATPAEPSTPPKRREIQEYEVAPGDTLYGIAERSGLQVETLLWVNDLKLSSLIRPGDKLKVLPVDGLLHEVRSGDTLSSLAERYKVMIEDITGYPENDLADPDRLVSGKVLLIPGGTKPPPPPPIRVSVRAPEPAPAPPAQASGGFIWPTYGPIFTYFSRYHVGLDISPPYGTPVVAAAPGVVTAANRWGYGYGYHIIVDHGGGLSTLYGHLSEFLVGVGEAVAQGQLIGRVGSTGRSTGPHLHFEVHRNGAPFDPLGVLPR